VAAYKQDDGFHEIQLNGKQLVFLFMAATVVSVVIFLCGVLVGRGVRAERGDLAQTDATSGDLAPAPSAEVARTPAPPAADIAVPPQPVDELSYFKRLEKPTAPVETLAKTDPAASKPPAKETPPVAKESAPAGKESAPTPKATAVPAPESAPAVRPESAPPFAARTEARAPESRPSVSTTPPVEPAAPAEAAPATGGFAVQVAALNVRSEADAMAKRLTSKGYSAYVLAAANGNPAVFRVRIGSYKTRREAEAMAAKLQQEEQIKPWVTR
jgi:cell division septation protein DedD